MKLLHIIKSIVKKHDTGPLVSFLIAKYLKFVYLTSHVEILSKGGLPELLETKDSFLISIWHRHIAFFPWGWPKSHPDYVTTFSSFHRDSQFITQTLERFRHRVCYFDKNQPLSGLKKAAKLLKNGDGNINRCYMVFTPDGPKGPRDQVKAGIVSLAMISQKPIICVAMTATKTFKLNSWDKLEIPLPFNKITLKWGECFMPEGELEESRQILQKMMEKLCSEIENYPR